MGLYSIKNLNYKGIEESGYITGETYINKVIPKEMKYVKSLYFVVKEEIIIPIPNEIPANNPIKTGNNRIAFVGCISPSYRKYPHKHKNKPNWMKNFNRLEMIVEIGVTILGK